MPILEDDIQIVASAVMDDVPEGGGAPSGTVIADGQSNGVFEDVTDLNAANGNVSIRKVFLRVYTPTTDKYAGVNSIVAAEPGDPLLSLTLFQTNDFFATRSDARSRIEAYLTQGALWQGFLYGNHVSGTKVIQLVQRPNTPQPPIGEVFTLVQDEGLAAQKTQYVRITKASYLEVVFTDDQGDFTRWIVTCQITNPLDYDFKGWDVARSTYNQAVAGKTVVRDTVVSNAAQYYGYQPLAVSAALGDRLVKAQSIFTQLVPSSEVDVPIADATANGDVAAPVAASTGTLTQTASTFNSATPFYIGGAIMPGTLKGVSGNASGVTDDGTGLLYNGADKVGTVDYQNGVLTSYASTMNGDWQFKPAAYPSVVTNTACIPFSEASRPLSVAFTMSPAPKPGVMTYQYRSQGQWYVLRDDGSGALRGDDPAYGAGKVNYSTGGVTITMGALPDAPSLALVTSDITGSYFQGYTGTVRGKFHVNAGEAMAPAATTLSWLDPTHGMQTVTISAAGVFSGACTWGQVLWGSGDIYFTPTYPTDPATVLSINYTQPTTTTSSSQTYNYPLVDMGTSWRAETGDTIAANSFAGTVTIVPNLSEAFFMGSSSTTTRRLTDDGAGGLLVLTSDGAGGTSSVKIGTVNYSTGVIVMAKDVTLSPWAFRCFS